jgi:hypothetical protein
MAIEQIAVYEAANATHQINVRKIKKEIGAKNWNEEGAAEDDQLPPPIAGRPRNTCR